MQGNAQSSDKWIKKDKMLWADMWLLGLQLTSREKSREHNEMRRVMETSLLVYNEGNGYNPHPFYMTIYTNVIARSH